MATLAQPIPLDRIPLKEAKRRLQQSLDAGDRVRATNHPDYWLVSSQSRPGFWHATSLAYCDCHAHAYRGICRHRVRLSWHLHTLRKAQAAA